MSNKVDELIGVLDNTPKKEYANSLYVFMVNNGLANESCIKLLIDELNNRLEAKTRAASILGSLFLPMTFGYLIYLLEKDTICSSSLSFLIAIGLIVILFMAAYFSTSYFVGKKGYVWRLSNAITALHEIELEMIAEEGKKKGE